MSPVVFYLNLILHTGESAEPEQGGSFLFGPVYETSEIEIFTNFQAKWFWKSFIGGRIREIRLVMWYEILDISTGQDNLLLIFKPYTTNDFYCLKFGNTVKLCLGGFLSRRSLLQGMLYLSVPTLLSLSKMKFERWPLCELISSYNTVTSQRYNK